MLRRTFLRMVLAVLAASLPMAGPAQEKRSLPTVPQSADPRLVVECFAAAPDIVHAIGCDFDSKGRLLVIESHTHFRPPDYQGPKHDRVRLLEDTDGDGRADRFTTFFEGVTAAMDIAVHPDGSVYLATRNAILRLRDTKGDGQADEQQRLVFLDTKGNYPHNGLSGLCFDSKGHLYFGLGENLGVGYQLIGSDGTTHADAGEGGNVFWCTADGRQLRRVATGFWNPFGICRDIFGRLFAVDNDPDASPPCRLLHVVEGGDFGYQFRYGRSGRHPFQAWHGQLPGTLPMVCGTGEAPCEVISYESDGLPQEYVGNLLVASWADHRLERYVLQPKGASFTAERKPFIQGGPDFYPVGLAVAPDGSLYVSDWGSRNYHLHGRGAVWRVRLRERQQPQRPSDPRRALVNVHRPLRDTAARTLAHNEDGRAFLRQHLNHANPRVRAAALTALLDSDDQQLNVGALLAQETEPALQALLVRARMQRQPNDVQFRPTDPPALQFESIPAVRTGAVLAAVLNDPDPYLRHAAVQQLARQSDLLTSWTREFAQQSTAALRTAVLLAQRRSGRPEAVDHLPTFLNSSDEDVRFLAVKWIADEKLSRFRPRLVKMLNDSTLNVRLYLACATALARLDNQEVNEVRLADYFFERLSDPANRLMALKLIPATHKKLTVEVLTDLLAQPDPALQLEAVRALNEHPSPQRFALLLRTAQNDHLSEAVRAQALVGLAEKAPDLIDDVLALAEGKAPALQAEALRALVGSKLNAAQQARLEKVAQTPALVPLAARVVGRSFASARPPAEHIDAWLERLGSRGDAEAGQRVFFHPKLAGCYRCHRVEGRGQDIGPDLSTIGHMPRRNLLESILQPNNLVAPPYQVWTLVTRDGKTHTGMLVHTHIDEYTYVDQKGTKFKLKTGDIEESLPVPTSLMPTGLVDGLTDEEIRDLLAYLTSRR